MSDYISREETINKLDDLCDIVCQYSKKQRSVMCGACPLGSAFDAIEELPTADVVERKKGKWKTVMLDHEAFGVRPTTFYCSECHQITTFRTFFCPNCGADMRQEAEE